MDRGSASDGTLITTWPRAEEGEWLLSIQLVDDVGEVVAFDLAAVVVAARPTMRLSINRLAASPDDVVRASVVVAPGTTPEPLRLVGWRVDADGTPIPLTFDHAGDFDAVDPPAESLRLLEDRLTEGTHRVEVRLVDEAGNERVAAGATVIVCDQATAVGGRLMDSEGAALTGAEGSVHAIDLGSGAMRTGAMAGEGSFSLELGPGHWFVTASAIAGGAIFEGSSSRHGRRLCRGAASDRRARVVGARATSGDRERRRRRRGAERCGDGAARVRRTAETTRARGTPDHHRSCRRVFVTVLR
ncbi:MAG: hypothetical protein M5U28_19745 [Sandaracinaceae bacterium]|nr:hypothetical protein [Sandaracinaceae bacterium]